MNVPPAFTQSSRSRKGETVDISKQIREIVFCDHAVVRPLWLKNGRAYRLDKNSLPIYMVAEEGKLKIMCGECFLVAVQVPINL